MKRIYCINCDKATQHIVFSEQVQCQSCGKGTKKPKNLIFLSHKTSKPHIMCPYCRERDFKHKEDCVTLSD